MFAHHNKTEALALPEGLNIEHVMPQNWRKHWPLPPREDGDLVQHKEDEAARDVVINTLGNLTLVTTSLNPAMSDSAWDVKRPELLKYSKLNLARYFHGPEADTWNEAAITARTKALFDGVLKTWPDVNRPVIP